MTEKPKIRPAIGEALRILEGSSGFFATHLAKRTDAVVKVYTKVLEGIDDDAIVEGAYYIVANGIEISPANLKEAAIETQEINHRMKLGHLAAQEIDIPKDEQITEEQRQQMMARLQKWGGSSE